MVLGEKGIRDYLRQGNFRDLFVRELGWDRYNEGLRIELPPDTYLLRGQAEKRGMAVFVCEPGPDGQIPSPAIRRKIDKQAAKSVHEHIIIYTNAAGTTQVWQWVKREAGKPDRPREYTFHAGQSGEPLIQRLNAITFTLDEEASLGIVDVAGRVRSAFDVDRVTKRFYDRFKTEHDRFLGFIQGITEQGDREWYASLMLNRLMFVYFIQKKGFLDGDLDYLRNRLKTVQRRRGQDQFLSFYRYFLLRLFHEGLGQSYRSPELDSLLGTVPYLNGGLFDVHQLEQQYADIEIADEAFERIFDFFDQYEWHLDTGPLRKDNEINPDVLGYIFEKYINQKQMGAYYTKEDITGYISKNTVIPFLFDDARKRCAIAFEPAGSVWTLLRDNPDRYIYEAVRKGVDLPLPENIAAGVHDVARRQDWNRAADPDYALPTETWREHVARRERCYEVRKKLASGQITDINDLVTYNLDIVQFAEDVLDDCEGPEQLRAFYRAIEDVTILDPTCGSGAFLFAALNILEPLYDASLDRMQAFVDELDRSDEPHSPNKYKDFRETRAGVARHPNRGYFIRKSIILNNLYGVDIMEEAVEIAKLRLFLQLVAHAEVRGGIEPLPDVDFNIRAGNTLVGFATYGDAEATVTSKLDWDRAMERIRAQAEDIERLFSRFREQQTEYGGEVTRADKSELRSRLAALDGTLNRYLASERGLQPDDGSAFDEWHDSHHPFHWFVEFPRILSQGGFDVIIGNPPYVEIASLKSQYSISGLSLTRTGNLYAVCVERFTQLLHNRGRLGVIMPISSVSTPRMLPLMRLLSTHFSPVFLSNFAVRPGKLFVGVDMNLTIAIGQAGGGRAPEDGKYSTRYNRWNEELRPFLFENLAYAPTSLDEHASTIPKIGTSDEHRLLCRIRGNPAFARYRGTIGREEVVFYHSGGRYFRKCLRDRLSNEYKPLKLQAGAADVGICLLSSSLYYWFWIAVSDCYHVTSRDIDAFPAPASLLGDERLRELASTLIHDLWSNATVRVRNRADGTQQEEVNFRVGESKPILDQIDVVLAEHYGLTPRELDLILNYDARYRMHAGADD